LKKIEEQLAIALETLEDIAKPSSPFLLGDKTPEEVDKWIASIAQEALDEIEKLNQTFF